MTTTTTEIEALMRARLAGLGDGRSIDPTEIARALAGTDERQWRLLMAPIRGTAIRLALAGEASILRKGKPVDPTDFKGVYRIAQVQSVTGAQSGTGDHG